MTASDVARILGLPRGHRRAYNAIATLRNHGWLQPLPVRGAYEYIPAASGPFPSGDAWIELRAALDHANVRAQIGLSSAAFLRGYAERRPDPESVFVDRTTRLASLERVVQVIHVLPERLFGATELRGLPVSTAERLVIEAAIWWKYAGDLRDSDHWLRRVVTDVDEAVLRKMTQRMTASGQVKVAYLVDRFGQPKLARRLTSPDDVAGLSHIGPRPGIYQADWNLYDGIGVARL